MRALLLFLVLAWASTAMAETPSPGSNPGATATQPPPVPAIPPGTPQTGAPSVPPERIAPDDRKGDASVSHGNALSRPPSSTLPENSGAAKREHPTTMPPELSR